MNLLDQGPVDWPIVVGVVGKSGQEFLGLRPRQIPPGGERGQPFFEALVEPASRLSRLTIRRMLLKSKLRTIRRALAVSSLKAGCPPSMPESSDRPGDFAAVRP